MRDETSSRFGNVGLWLSIYLIGLFLWRLFTPAHEYDLRSVQMLDMALDALATVGPDRVFCEVLRHRESAPPRAILLWGALASTAGIWLIRLSSDEGWWTGHRLYWLSPR